MLISIRYILISVICISALVSNGQPFQFIYQTTEDEIPTDAVQDAVGNYFILGIQGEATGGSFGNYDGLIQKLNPSGDTVSRLIYRYNFQNTILNAILLNDSSELVVIGSVYDSVLFDWQILYLKIDTSLNILSEKIIGHPYLPEVILRARWGKNNDILCSGYTLTTPTLILYYRFSVLGDSLISSYISGDVTTPIGFDLIPFQDTVNYLGFSYGQTVSQPLQLISNQILILNHDLQIDSVILINNSGVMVASEWLNDTSLIVCTKSFNPLVTPLDLNFRIQRFNNSLNILSDTLFGSVDTADAEALNPLSISSDGYIYFGGTSNYQNNWWGSNPAFYYVVKFNPNLSVNWLRYINYNNEYLNLYKVLATSDGGVLLAGTKYNVATSNGQERDIYVIKLDSLGNFVTGTGDSPGVTVHDFIAYPNPATTHLTLQYSPPKTTGMASVFNATGSKVSEIILPKNSLSLQLDISQYPAGLYLLKIETESYSGAKKFIKF